jgi:tRNA U34 2-thiouridine synthase MnmA/TrmU
MPGAIVLLSGGLDSTLAARLIIEQGIETEAVNFTSVFHTSETGKTIAAAQSAADKLGIRLTTFEISEDIIKMVKDPRYGYGSNMNPCIDCRIFIFKKAAEYMKKSGGSFLVTGEVLGQRPMSQRKDAMRIIERDSGLKGLVLRPLSAKMLDPTIPEKEGVVDRERLLAIDGRSRKTQIQLARDFDINDYPAPAGGCLLTDPGFANRMKDLMRHKPDFTIDDIRLLKIGRHFRLTPDAKVVIGRNKEENNSLLGLTRDGDLCFRPSRVKGPVGVGRGSFDMPQLCVASSIVARYSDGKPERELEITYRLKGEKAAEYVTARPLNEQELSRFRI